MLPSTPLPASDAFCRGHAIHDAPSHGPAVPQRVLHLGALRVRGEGEHEQAPPGLVSQIQRRAKGLKAEKGADGDGVRTQRAVLRQIGPGVRRHGRADVTPLHVEQGKGACLTQTRQRALEHRDPRRTETLEEGGLGLDHGHGPGERLDAGHGKRLKTRHGLIQAPVRQQSRVGVYAGTERSELGHGQAQPDPERLGRPE